ncbi:MAG TPA: response regulator [Polyangiaceae bacterium]|nr:response regulator [Polyangiaceae bacterium]
MQAISEQWRMKLPRARPPTLLHEIGDFGHCVGRRHRRFVHDEVRMVARRRRPILFGLQCDLSKARVYDRGGGRHRCGHLRGAVEVQSRNLKVGQGSERQQPQEARAAKGVAVLLVEDDDNDELLVLRALQRGGYAPSALRVDNREAFLAALKSRSWDVIISDHTLPQYSGLRALADLRDSGKDLPFILVSGTVGEAGAVEVMKAGAQDYVLKGDLSRLPAAVDREVREAAVRAERARMREQLVLSERMASAGTLAAGLAHEINNPLAVAMANIEFIGETINRVMGSRSDESGPASEWEGWNRIAGLEAPLDDVRDALVRMRDVVKDVKLFSGPNKTATDAVDVVRIIDSSIRMAWNEIRHRARVVRDYQSNQLVQASESRLGQVILNLVINAAQAMTEGQADRNELRVRTLSNNDRVVVEIADTGVGIPEENLSKLFRPFFTTKGPGVGTGLGLAICHKIVSELGGLIEVQSQVGLGTTFRLDLPAARESQTIKIKTLRPAPSERPRVLVVDDEPAVGRAMQRSLGGHLDVTTATSAQEALGLLNSGETYDVILSDLMMPEITGMDFYAELVRRDPARARQVVFMTGGAFTAKAREFLNSVSNPRVEKPVEVANLLAIVAGLVQRPQT